MIKKLLITTFFFFVTIHVFTQEISGKVFKTNSTKPLVNVALLTNLKTGTTTNKIGGFLIDSKDIKTITFSCLGFLSKTLSVKELEQVNFIVYLDEIVNQLAEIQLNLATISLDSLLIKALKSMKENYLLESTKQDFFAIEGQGLDFKKLDLELKSSSILSRKNKKLAETELQLFSDNIQKRKPEFSFEYKGVVLSKESYSAKTKKKFTIYNVDSLEGYKKEDFGKDITVKNITDKLQNIVLKYLDESKTYKVKSGLFKVEDSVSIKEVRNLNDSINLNKTFSNYNTINYNRSLKEIGMFFDKNKEENFMNQKYYNHSLERSEVLGVSKYYVVSFQPEKSKSKFAGKMYIDPLDFSIKKIVYKYAEDKRGEHINLKFLLGVKFSENENYVTIYYEKTDFGKVYASYFKEKTISYAYVDRPLKFIENTKDKNKVKFNIKVEVTVTDNMETFVKNTIPINSVKVKIFKKEDLNKRTGYLTENEYANKDWKYRQLINDYLIKYK